MSMNGIKGPRGGNLRNGRTTFPHVVARQQRAAERQAAAANRTPEEQLKRLDAAGLVSVKERMKLAKRIAARDAKPPEAPKAEKKTKSAKGQASGSSATP